MMDFPLKVFLKKNPFFAIFLPLPTKTISPHFFLLFLRIYIISLQSNQTKETTFPFLFFFFSFLPKIKNPNLQESSLKKKWQPVCKGIFSNIASSFILPCVLPVPFVQKSPFSKHPLLRIYHPPKPKFVPTKKRKIPPFLSSKFSWSSFQIDDSPFPPAQKAKKYDLENLW